MPQARNDTSMNNESRSISDIAITVSPVYVTPKNPKLKKGEIIEHPVAPRYSTLDHEMIAKLNVGKKQIQQRYNPPAAGLFGHDDAPMNGRPQKGTSTSNSGGFSGVNSSSFPGPISLAMYEYGPPEFIEDKPTSKPMISVQKYPSMQTDDKMPNGYKSPSSNYHVNDAPEMEYPNFDDASSYENDGPAKKPMKFPNHQERPFPFAENSYGHDHHDFHHEVIYDHLPEYHHIEHTTQEPEMNDQRLDKRPYSYYFIGKKLWYIPLYFSIYFIIYIAALVLKSIARHKINFPTHLAEAAGHSKRSEPDEWWDFAGRILDGVERLAEVSGAWDS
ncbi:hypothetical protein EAI_10732 [Harpegnathos saltator]|uniref:Uncharacterized protein n=3 Tax=Harpegnathos saltator TaxID=610380 RepID=E2BWC9_HARSA|nr:hypothetical protein EAI_10732 [Harpegnathos saltator]